MSTAGTDRTPAIRHPTLLGAAIVGIVLVHLLALAVGSIRPFPDGALLEGLLVISLATTAFLVERSARATAIIVLPYAVLVTAALIATVTVEALWVAIGLGATAALLLYGVHRYGLVRLGLLEGSS